jgi:hypothetical protein
VTLGEGVRVVVGVNEGVCVDVGSGVEEGEIVDVEVHVGVGVENG